MSLTEPNYDATYWYDTDIRPRHDGTAIDPPPIACSDRVNPAPGDHCNIQFGTGSDGVSQVMKLITKTEVIEADNGWYGNTEKRLYYSRANPAIENPLFCMAFMK